MRLVSGTGEVVEIADADTEELSAARVALGALGVMTRITLRVVPARVLRGREWCVDVDELLLRREELERRNRNFDFYWYPRRDEAQIRILNEPTRKPDDLIAELAPRSGDFHKDQCGPAHVVQPQDRGTKFEEMEHALPAERFAEAFEQTRRRLRQEHRRIVGWRVLVRSVAGDDGMLSPFAGRDNITVAHLQNATLPRRRYFEDMEPRMRALGGRPHYGKKHSARAADLRSMGLELDRFNAVRERFDPDGVFLNAHLRDLLGVPER